MGLAAAMGNDEYFAESRSRRGWSKRYIGYKSSDLTERKEAYEVAQKDWRSVLEKSRDINTRISAIKGLILLPGEDVQQWCNIGMQEAQESELVFQDKENIKAELGNSKGIDIRKTDPEKALDEFLKRYKTVQHGIVIAGHLMQNAGTCWLILKDKTEDPYWKLMYATRAIPLLEKALEEYPADQIEHRKSTQNKIDKTREEIKKLENK